MTGRPRDSQRSRVYAAERCLPQHNVNVFGDVAQTQKFLDDVLAQRWFRVRWNLRGGVEVRPGRGAASAAGGHINVGRRCRNPAVVLHELAHEIIRRDTRGGLAEHAAHGPAFAAVLAYLVRQVMGPEPAQALVAQFRAHRVRYRAGAVPGPRYHVPTEADVAAVKRERATRPIGLGARAAAVDVIRRAVRAGEFGAAGTRTRAAANLVARTIERSPS